MQLLQSLLLLLVCACINAFNKRTSLYLNKLANNGNSYKGSLLVQQHNPSTVLRSLEDLSKKCGVLNKENALKMSSQMSGASKTPKLPKHANLLEGKLSNGFSYVILPNANPPNRFEAHLEVLSGSVYELEHQQGMAHLLEHTAYMGSPKRQELSSTGSKTNAYTDFHHTVFFAGCPTHRPDDFWKRPMLPMALDALLDVMTCRVDDQRLEKERAAVLSEASMVNKVDYRVECQILGTLHNENRVSSRFPIGKEHLIKSWTKGDLQHFHDTHYRPDNAVLYVVGDIDPAQTVKTIEEKFGHLRPKNDRARLLSESKEFPPVSMGTVNRHFPPVTHHWSAAPLSIKHLVPDSLLDVPVSLSSSSPDRVKRAGVFSEKPPLRALTLHSNAGGDDDNDSKQAVSSELSTHSLSSGSGASPKVSLPVSTVFRHELLTSFSFHLFAKRPIEPVTSEAALKRDLATKLALMALQIRLNVQQRQDPLFASIDFNQNNWVREGCAVCSLDMTCDPQTWRKAVIHAIKEVRRLGLFGLSASELRRYKDTLLSESAQSAVQSREQDSEAVLQEVMRHEQEGHTYMDPVERHATVQRLLDSTTLSDVNSIAHELCEHLSHMQPDLGVRPVAIVTTAPTTQRNGASLDVTEEDVASAVAEAISLPVEPLPDTAVPDTLISPEQMAAKRLLHPPEWVTVDEKVSRAIAAQSPDTIKKLGVVQRKLSNGIRVNLKSLSAESQRFSLRLYMPGGRMLESDSTVGAVELGARTIQEGGAFLRMTREEVELFCIDHNVVVEISACDDGLLVDLSSVTTQGPGGLVSGAEAAVQVAHVLLTDFRFEEDAFQRAKQALHEKFDSAGTGLESACLEKLTHSITGGDSRFLEPSHKQLEALDLDTVRHVMKRQLSPANVEVSMSGNLPMELLQSLALDYFGTVPSDGEVGPVSSIHSLKASVMGKKAQLGVHVPDSEERAMGYIAGPAPNDWGVFHDGRTVSNLLNSVSGDKLAHRRHPLFGHLALLVLQEVANRVLFSVVREERQLTYDASFQIEGHDSLRGGWYLVSVTSSPSQVQAALVACREALGMLSKPHGVHMESVEAAKRTLLSRFHSESRTNRFWVERLSGTQSDLLPLKSAFHLADFERVLRSVTAQDIQQLVKLFAFAEENMTVCAGTSSPFPPTPSLNKQNQQQ